MRPDRRIGEAATDPLGAAWSDGPREWIVRPTSANRLSAAACYPREPGADRAEITKFGPALDAEFGVAEYLCREQLGLRSA